MPSISNAITGARAVARHTSWRSTVGAASTAVIVLFGFFYERIFDAPLPADVRDALVLLFAAAVTWWGATTRDNRVSSENVGLKENVTATIGAGSTMTLAQPVEVVEPQSEPVAVAKDPS